MDGRSWTPASKLCKPSFSARPSSPSVPSEAAPVRADAAADVQTGCRTMLGLIVTGIAGGALAQAALAEAAKPIKLGPPPPPSGEGEVLPAAAAAGGRRRRGRRR
ncbi:Os05g0313100 [Oryza sativa Japonica Group]|uniref:Os05g0313100 protein n=1 Tax=Oryza sativa subsp. japonica TaxID=39947 RepID=A0A0P0WKP3_ORYSJ|nr:hypothetical protein EE612_028574 [Oryza sativa]BAS93304.1 Os05g0313100 [Oryza sativa Japonica Group]